MLTVAKLMLPRISRRKGTVQDADLRLIKLVRQADGERQRRIQAEKVAAALRATNARLREQMRVNPDARPRHSAGG